MGRRKEECSLRTKCVINNNDMLSKNIFLARSMSQQRGERSRDLASNVSISRLSTADSHSSRDTSKYIVFFIQV